VAGFAVGFSGADEFCGACVEPGCDVGGAELSEGAPLSEGAALAKGVPLSEGCDVLFVVMSATDEAEGDGDAAPLLLAGALVEAGADDGEVVVLASGDSFLEAEPFTVTLQVSFFPPVFACIVAFPAFFPFIFTLFFVLEDRETIFLPFVTVQTTLPFAFLSFRVFVLPTFMVSLDFASLGLAAADDILEGSRPTHNTTDIATENDCNNNFFFIEILLD
jgi:hypothetical protein